MLFSNSKELSKILFFDIETVSTTRRLEELSEAMQKMWSLKSRSIAGEEALPSETYTERAGIYAEFGKIVCISFGFLRFPEAGKPPHFRVKSFFGEDEAILLVEFKNLLDRHFRDHRLCAHNGKEFDIPYLCRRMIVHQIPLPDVLNLYGKKPWEIQHLDTMELWKFGDRKAYTKLELLCALFDIPTPKDDIDGSQVGRVYWEEQGVERIARYCEKDVVATAQVFLRYNLMPPVVEENIEYRT